MSDQGTKTSIDKYATINDNIKAVEKFPKNEVSVYSYVRNFNYCNTKQNVIIHPFIINH